jgi:putative endonuclease
MGRARCGKLLDPAEAKPLFRRKPGPIFESAMFFAYLLASRPYGTLYVGSTSDLVRRVWEHKVKAVPGFTAKYGVDRLIWFEWHDTLEAAMMRERRIKSW